MQTQGEALYDFSMDAAQAQSNEDIWLALQHHLGKFGVKWINYAYGNPAGDFLLYSNMTPEWLSYYMEHYRDTDMLIEYCATPKKPLYLGNDYFKGEAGVDKANDNMFQNIREQDSFAGISIPLRKKKADYLSVNGVFFGLSEKDSREALTQHGEEISLIMSATHQHLHGHTLSPASGLYTWKDNDLRNQLPLLTDREKDVLRYLALGIRPDRIAEKMGLEVVTVNMHVQKAKRRLGTATREQTIVAALQMRQLVL